MLSPGPTGEARGDFCSQSAAHSNDHQKSHRSQRGQVVLRWRLPSDHGEPESVVCDFCWKKTPWEELMFETSQKGIHGSFGFLAKTFQMEHKNTSTYKCLIHKNITSIAHLTTTAKGPKNKKNIVRKKQVAIMTS